MAKFKNSNLQLKTNQKVQFGDSQEVELIYNSSEFALNTDENASFNIVGDTFMGVATGGKGGGVAVDIKQSTQEFNVGVGDASTLFNIQNFTWQLGDTNSVSINSLESSRSEWFAGDVKIKLDGTGFKTWIEFWAGSGINNTTVARIGPDPTDANIGVYLNDVYSLDGVDSTSSTNITLHGDVVCTGNLTANEIISDSTSLNIAGDLTVTGNITCDDLFVSADTIYVGTGEIKSEGGNIQIWNDGLFQIGNDNTGWMWFGKDWNDGSNGIWLDVSGGANDGQFYIYSYGGSVFETSLETSLVKTTIKADNNISIAMSGNDQAISLKAPEVLVDPATGVHGLISLTGSPNASGGELRIYPADNQDDTIDYYSILVPAGSSDLKITTNDSTATVIVEGDVTVTGDVDVSGTVSASDPVDANDLTTLDYMAKLGTDRTRLTYDGTSDLDISIEHIVDVEYTDFKINQDPPPWKEGRVFWDKINNTFGVYNDDSDVILQVGQETHIKIRNESGSMIPNGSICYVSGSSQGRATIELADASDQDKTEGLCVVTHDLENNANGYGTVVGMVREVDTIGFSHGVELYLSETTPGTFRTGRPSAPDYVVDVGFVIVGDSTANGEILVSFINHGDFATLADVNIPTPPTNGQTLVYSEDNQAWEPENSIQVLSYTLPLTGATDTQIPLTGTFVTKASGVTADDTTDYAIGNQHVFILINSVTGADSTGTITVTGTSLSESTAVPVSGDTEVIHIDSTAGVYYQTNKKWMEITNIAISPDIAAIDYDHGALGYPDLGNRDFKIIGYRMDAYAGGVNPDMRLIIRKVSDIGNKVTQLIDLEDIGVDSGAAANQIIDHIRTGADDRSYNPAVGNIWDDSEVLTFKQLDFDTYWTNNENEIFASQGDTGFIIRIEGEPAGGGISNVQFINLLLYYVLL